MNKLLSVLGFATILSSVGTSSAAGGDKTAAAPARNLPPQRPPVQLGLRAGVAVPQDIDSYLGTTFTSDVISIYVSPNASCSLRTSASRRDPRAA
jgi:hypothetical protein